MRFVTSLLFLFFFFTVEAQEGAVVQSFQSPLYERIEWAFLSPDQQTVIAADTAGYVIYWRKQDGSFSKIMRAHNHAITGMALSGDGKYFGTTSGDKKIFLWDFTTGGEKSEINPGARCFDLIFSPDGDALIFADESGVYRSALNNFSNPVKIFHSAMPISCIAAVDNGNYLAIGASDVILLVNPANGKLLSKTKACKDITHIRSSTNYLSCGCADGTLQLFEVKGNSLKKKNGTKTSMAQDRDLLLAPSQKNVFFISNEGTLQIWDWSSNQLFPADSLPARITALSAADSMILIGDSDGLVSLCKAPVVQNEAGNDAIHAPAVNSEMPKSLNERKVKVKEEPVEVKSSQFDLYVWDDENVDGDTISLNMNGKWILQNYMVIAEKKKLSITLEPGRKNYLILYAQNLGKTPPNTAVISFNDGNKERILTLNSDMKRCDAVSFILKNK